MVGTSATVPKPDRAAASSSRVRAMTSVTVSSFRGTGRFPAAGEWRPALRSVRTAQARRPASRTVRTAQARGRGSWPVSAGSYGAVAGFGEDVEEAFGHVRFEQARGQGAVGGEAGQDDVGAPCLG